MARKTKVRSSGIFLMELTIAILFFSVASAVCAQIFVKVHQLSEEAEQLTQAVSCCSSTAEVIRSADTPDEIGELLLREFPKLQAESDGFSVSVEENTLQILKTWENPFCTVHLRYLDPSGSCIYELSVERYFREVAP